MPKTNPFNAYADRYEAWFVRHGAAYVSELLALRPFIPWEGRGIEIGVGSGRFAAPLGLQVGVDPSPTMLARAAARGITVVEGTAENLPFQTGCFDYALAVTTICFVDSPAGMLAEAHRVLRPGGRLVVGFVDRESDLGKHYLAHQAESVFYREATFYSAGEVARLLAASGFSVETWGQTLVHPFSENGVIDSLRPGHGRGAFVVAAARREPAGRS